MSIHEGLSGISERIEHLQLLKQASLVTGQLEKILQDMRERRKSIEIELELADVLLKGNILSSNKMMPINKLNELHANVMVQFKKDPTEITKGKNYKKLLDEMEKITNALREYVKQSWDKYKVIGSSVDPGLLYLIERIPKYRSQVQEIRRIISDLEYMRGRIPENEEELKLFERARNKLEEERKKLDPEGWPNAVRTFLQQAQDASGAPFDAMSEEVKKWMDEKGLLSNIRIVLRTVDN